MRFIKFNYKNLFLIWGISLLTFLSTSFLVLQLTTPKIPLFGFHGIIDIANPVPNSVVDKMEYSKQDLEVFLEYLIQHNYWFLNSQDLYDFFLTKSKDIPLEHLNQKPILISFDDGYKSVYTNLIPILSKLKEKYGKQINVVLFVNPGTMAKPGSTTSNHLGCQELREGLKKGFYDVQSHGLTHKNLTQISPQNLVDELLQAQTQLRQCTQGLDPDQKVASHLAYPYGAYNKRVETYASKYYLSSYLYNTRILKYCWLKNYHEIPRFTVNRGKSPSQLIKMAERSHQIKKKEKC